MIIPRRIILTAVFFITCVLIAGYALLAIPSFTDVPLSDLHWKKAPSLIAAPNDRDKGAHALSLVRLKDGIKQYFVGDFSVSFADNGNASIFGTPKNDPKAQKLYHVEQGRTVRDIDVKSGGGIIRSVQENASGSYLFIEIAHDKSTGYCIFERISDKQKPSCEFLSVGTISRGLWNPNKDHEVVVLTSTGFIFTHDPWESKPKRISKEDEEYERLYALFSQPPVDNKTLQTKNGRRTLLHLLWMVIIRDEKKHLSVYRVPLFARIAWIGDDDHLLIKESGHTAIAELSTRRKAPFITTPKKEPFPIIIPSQGGIITF